MKKIKVHSFLSTNIHNEFSQVTTIEIDNNPIAEGAFGAVYLCISINNRSILLPQVIKIFKEDKNNKQDHNFETIQKFQNKLSSENATLKNLITDEYPSLKGIPQFSFIGNLNGKKVRGFSSTNLKKIGFNEFIDTLENPNLLSSYQKLSIDKKMLIAYHLASGFKVLQKMFFIHADLKPEALFINTSTNECAIIDFDSGAITENLNDEPNVWGSPNDWIAPEIWEQLKQTSSTGLQKVKVNLLSDLWSVTIGIHYILTTTHPLFYLTELSPRVTNQYFSNYKWPDINDVENYFNNNNKSIYQPVKKWLQNTLQHSIYNQLEKTINYGYNNPIHRTTYNEWENVLKSVQTPPVIDIFESDRKTLIKGIPIHIKWEVRNAYQVLLNNGIGPVPLNGKKQLNLSDNTVLKLTAVGYFGSISEELTISVFPTPVIKSLTVPSPHFKQNIVLQINTPKFNMINQSSININNSIHIDELLHTPIQYTQDIVFPIKEIKRIKKELDQQTLKYKLVSIYEKIKARFAQLNR
ncbi:serine/threonine protein kinase [Aquimarina sp. EL_43]|uniref:protein kinase domain-containing protein n=1 Tax=unclassified Aquimarina TaxID=2627091 RepID=UPI0018CBD09D|nr:MULTISPECIES: protein kinase [unclassified Aquimarina]MBG6129985.1 serine/threonine protein kinase [Aquimarina sp. EL_35]MBG6148765.1 serine/threonine protein kinase [Aquimarina sp. EL_32]MBG6168861.1 serine/threonine protein kinase [Aquimarina sp. EL_43]